jgi:hypothetical protein
MRNLLPKIAAALITFALGAASGAVWLRFHEPAKVDSSQPAMLQEQPEFTLTSILVARSLQTRVIPTKNLKRNSSNEIIWRWLKQEIARYQSIPGYENQSLVLPLSDTHEYRVTLYQMNEEEFKAANQVLLREGLPLLKADHQYARLGIHIDDIICPNWGGYVDLEEPRLVFFRGSGG